MAFVPSDAVLDASIAALVTNVFAPATHPLHVHLASAPFTPSRTSNPASFTEATFDGYAAATITAFSAAHKDKFTQWLQLGPLQVFTPTGSTTPNTIYGYWLVTDSGTYVGGEVFGTPVTLNGPTTTLQFVPGVAMPQWNYTAPIMP